MSNYKKIIMLFFPLIVLVCGILGLMISEGYGFFDSLFLSIIMFAGGYGDPTDSLLVNIARYGALLVTASWVLSFLHNATSYIKDHWNSAFNKALFVYGENDYSKQFIENTTRKTINRRDYIGADAYVLLSKDEDNLLFYEQHKNTLNDKNVYIKNSTISNVITNKGKHRFFSLEEIIAREYWKNNPILDQCFIGQEAKTEVNIAIIGFDRIAEELIREAVIINIFDPKQVFRYHVFGDAGSFKLSHIHLEQLNIVVHDKDYTGQLDLLNRCERIIFLDRDSAVDEIDTLIGSLERGDLHLITHRDIDSELLLDHKYGRNRNISLSVINYMEGLCTEDNIINQKGIDTAKRMNAAYSKNDPASPEEKWEKLDTFTRFSNIASVDYFNITTKRLLEKKTGKEYESISDQDLKPFLPLLTELEHIRWCNYHLFANWKYGKETIKSEKTHNCLVPFDELIETEKQKDTNQVLFMRKEKL